MEEEMRDLDCLAVFLRELHDHPLVDGGVSQFELHMALVSALDDIGLGDIYRDFHAAIGGDAVYSANATAIVRVVNLDGEVEA
jgi:hypothetical protein